MEDKAFEILAPSRQVLETNRSKKALICHPGQVVRSSIATALSKLELTTNNVSLISDNFEELRQTMGERKPDIVFCSEMVEGRPYQDVLAMHEREFPNRAQTVFFVVSEEATVSKGVEQLEYFFDGLLSVPFTPQTLNNLLIEEFEARLRLSVADLAFFDARASYLTRNYDEALKKFQACRSYQSNRATAQHFIAQIHILKNDFEGAVEAYEMGLAFDPSNYYCLHHYIQLLMRLNSFEKAYDLNLTLLENYPLHEMFIPQIVKLSIASHNYNDLLDLVQIFKSVQTASEKVKNYFSAGLIIGAKVLLKKGEINAARTLIEKSFEVSPKNLKIITNGCLALAEASFHKDAILILEKAAGSHISDDYFVSLQIEINSIGKDYGAVLKLGQGILNHKLPQHQSYKLLIDAAIASQLPRDRIINMIDRSIYYFPEQIALFDAYRDSL